jgi:hypothetical protein
MTSKTDRRAARTPWRHAFLDSLAEGAPVRAAAQRAGVARSTVYAHRDTDPEFAEAWDDAYMAGNDLLEDEAHRRAVDGVEQPVMYRGQVVASVREYSDQLLTFLLRGRRPDVYGTQRVTAKMKSSGLSAA